MRKSEEEKDSEGKPERSDPKYYWVAIVPFRPNPPFQVPVVARCGPHCRPLFAPVVIHIFRHVMRIRLLPPACQDPTRAKRPAVKRAGRESFSRHSSGPLRSGSRAGPAGRSRPNAKTR